jgi:hypothetical protein
MDSVSIIPAALCATPDLAAPRVKAGLRDVVNGRLTALRAPAKAALVPAVKLGD